MVALLVANRKTVDRFTCVCVVPLVWGGNQSDVRDREAQRGRERDRMQRSPGERQRERDNAVVAYVAQGVDLLHLKRDHFWRSSCSVAKVLPKTRAHPIMICAQGRAQLYVHTTSLVVGPTAALMCIQQPEVRELDTSHISSRRAGEI